MVLCVAFTQLQFVYRDVGLNRRAADTQQFKSLDTNGQFSALLYAIYLIPSHHEYFMEPAEPYFLIHWVPRTLWPTKPIMKSWTYYNASYVHGYWFNVTPSLLGQYHINWGLSGVLFVGAWFGLLTSAADHLMTMVDVRRSRAVAIVVGVFYAFLVASFRFYSPIYFAYVLFAFLGMITITRHVPEEAAAPGTAATARIAARSAWSRHGTLASR